MSETGPIIPLLEIKNLKVGFKTDKGVVHAVRGVDLIVRAESTLCLVGESGCGKSVTALSVMGLVQIQGGRIESGEILYHKHGKIIDLAKQHPFSRTMRKIRGNEIAMIFQEPMTSLNPVYTIGNQILETIILHQKIGRREARDRAVELLRAVGIPHPESRIDEYPHQLSGGMRQRAMIAMALCCNPSLLIADEPTTALDVTIQAQVLDLMKELRHAFQAAILFITHDLGVVANMADDVIVMYLGQVVEAAPVRVIFNAPLHPYTKGLLRSVPSMSKERKNRLSPIRGAVPDIGSYPAGCAFAPRCEWAVTACHSQMPPLAGLKPGHKVACFELGGLEVRTC
ncbi:MAG: ABC transporter ATP-binding protein [Deltaproteobacteria bacterium]|nr:ABC transporter ATP-binding protein [Deltaproteobacteria bacterium]MBW1960293.1 ABC transporter ATP-binding protein [Deltaproteobacteria bacterium]MBW2150190.1 ABC transporter ATP-binding protein [Deltaproteobacteria bacterium]